jgi:hypothetical protein
MFSNICSHFLRFFGFKVLGYSPNNTVPQNYIFRKKYGYKNAQFYGDFKTVGKKQKNAYNKEIYQKTSKNGVLPLLCSFFWQKDVWIRTQSDAVASRRATNLATHLPT